MISRLTIARALGGEVVRGEILAPGPNHSRADRSLCVKLSAQSPWGFVAHSFAGDSWQTCRDYVAARLGITPDRGRPWTAEPPSLQPGDPTNADRIARAVGTWAEAVNPCGTIVERYLNSRGLDLPHDVAGAVIRFHAACPWREGETTIRVPAMVGAMRQVDGDAITAIHRTRLTPDGRKLDRRMLGIAAGAAVKLDADDIVTTGLAIGEGIETCLAARQIGFRPAWALASAGAMAAFPVLDGIEAVTLLAEADDASDRAIGACADRWAAAGREVVIVVPGVGSDLNDALRGAA